jgi:hypothetical protein
MSVVTKPGAARRPHRQVALLALVVWFIGAGTAHAYIDPGSGAVIWQALLAAFFGALFFLRGFVRRVRTRFGGKRDKDAEDGTAAP